MDIYGIKVEHSEHFVYNKHIFIADDVCKIRALHDGILPNEILEKHRTSPLNERREKIKKGRLSRQPPQSLDRDL